MYLREAPGDKSAKVEVNYTSKASEDFCSTCTMFLKPDGCTSVEGKISPKGSCNIYEARDAVHD